MSCSTSKNKSCVNGANLWLHFKISTWTERWVSGKDWKVFRITHRVGVCCEGWLMRSSSCWRVVGHRDDQSGMISVSAPWEFSREAADHVPPPLLAGRAPKWPMLTATLLLSFLGSFPLSHLDEARTSLWLCGADQLTNGREVGGAEGDRGRDWEEGFYVTEWKIPRRDRHMPLLFLSSYTPSLPLPSSLVPCLPFFVADLNPLSSVSPSGSSDGQQMLH